MRLGFSSIVVIRNARGFDRRQQCFSQLLIPDLLEMGNQIHGFVIELRQRRRFCGVFLKLLRQGEIFFGAFEEIADLYIEYAGQFVKSARRYTVHALFVLLDLLEGQAELFAQLFLCPFQFLAAPANPLTDQFVDPVG